MDADAYSAELATAMESSFAENPNTGQHCHGIADAYMASLPGDTPVERRPSVAGRSRQDV